MSLQGYVRHWRDIRDWRWRSDPNTFSVFWFLVEGANFKDAEWRDLSLKRGQLFTSRDSIAATCGLTRQEVKTSLEKLRKCGAIVTDATPRGLLVTLCNYDRYNGGEQGEQPASNHLATTEQPASNLRATYEQPTSNMLATTEQPQRKKDKKDKKEENEENEKKTPKPPKGAWPGFEEFWSRYPKKEARAAAESAWNKIKPLLADVLTALEWQIPEKDWIGEGRKYAPQASAYLNQRRWEDENPNAAPPLKGEYVDFVPAPPTDLMMMEPWDRLLFLKAQEEAEEEERCRPPANDEIEELPPGEYF